MKLYRKKIEPLTEAIVTQLVQDEDIDITSENRAAVTKDIHDLLDAYVHTEYEVAQETKEVIAQEKGLRYDQFGKIRKILSTDRDHEGGAEGIEWLTERLIEYLLSDDKIDEVYSEDHTLRKKIFAIFRHHLQVEDELDEEVRGRIRNIRETDPAFQIEYDRVMRDVKRKRGLI